MTVMRVAATPSPIGPALDATRAMTTNVVISAGHRK
jgi:hypothetical protein